jgi:hypothetical protein
MNLVEQMSNELDTGLNSEALRRLSDYWNCEFQQMQQRLPQKS